MARIILEQKFFQCGLDLTSTDINKISAEVKERLISEIRDRLYAELNKVFSENFDIKKEILNKKRIELDVLVNERLNIIEEKIKSMEKSFEIK